MIYDVKISAQADVDLRGIYEYIAYELQSPENANAQLNRLEKNIMKLAQMPERFRHYEKEPWHSRGLRIMPSDNYCILYVANAERPLSRLYVSCIVAMTLKRSFKNTQKCN